ncbi:hypothetical protein MPNT_10022 [Candidatus Methylacidithermus pantelleriae]|uniref:Uncharacterized protein n=1 Tax=Candidatus Methylacidithermus pantelleriae TaxID=2744239 RepID=A0A8J2BLC5_9BACT|nr:hypothetical protein MPNT_10022 [Candidatus Methylacidithermus pantelleriae]
MGEECLGEIYRRIDLWVGVENLAEGEPRHDGRG